MVSWQQEFGDKFYSVVEFTVYEMPVFSYGFQSLYSETNNFL